MKIRLEGSKEQIAETIRRMRTVFEVHSESKFYPNNGSIIGRVYVDFSL